MTLALAHSRRWLDYDERVATYWPEFAQNGKETTTVRQLLGHQAGLFALDVPVDRRLEAWWTDGGRVESLDGSIHQITPVGDRGISYLVRNDLAAWPAGRYEFHVSGDGRSYALTICIPAEG